MQLNMEGMKAKWVIKIILGSILFFTLVGFGVMYLWNFVMPYLFGLPLIDFWKAIALFILSKILFRSHGGWVGKGLWNMKMKEKWNQMSPEEKDRFRESWKMRCEKWKK
jgi:hypothetical protein